MEQVCEQFPGWKSEIEQLYLEDEIFQEMCQDYQEACGLVAAWTAPPDVHPETIRGYRTLLTELEAEIEAGVMAIGETRTVGNIRATYSGGRKTYDYRTAAAEADPEIVVGHTTVEMVRKTDWRGVCHEAKIVDIPFTQSSPSVSIKRLKVGDENSG